MHVFSAKALATDIGRFALNDRRLSGPRLENRRVDSPFAACIRETPEHHNHD